MQFMKKKDNNVGVRAPLCAIFARIVVALFLSTTATAEDSWDFLVMSDWHGAEWYSHKPVLGEGQAPDDDLFLYQKNTLEHIYALYGGDLIVMPGDTNDGRWYRQDWIKKHFPGHSTQDAVYKAGINCYGTIKNLFSSAGYEKILVAVGDHELGDNYWGPRGKDAKTDSLTQFRDSFVQGFYKEPNTGEYIFKNYIGNAPPTPYETDYEYTSFAHRHNNVLFITVDVFREVSNTDYFDRTKGLGGEGIITGDVAGLHLKWIEEVLIEGRKDKMIKHIIVQAHVPILQPVRQVRSSGMFFDRAEHSPFWKMMVKYEVDIYFAGEVHANSVSRTKNSNLLQVVSRAQDMSSFLKVTVNEDSLQVDAINKIGQLKFPEDSGLDGKYENIGTLVIDKSSTTTKTSFSGELELVDISKPLLRFDFEKSHGINERQVFGLQTRENLRPEEVAIHDMVVSTAIWNQGSLGKQYDAPVGNVQIVQGNVTGNAGYFYGPSQMGVYSFGPQTGGDIISYSILFRTTQTAEGILIHFGQSWGRTQNRYSKNIFSLTLDNGTPKLYASQSSILQPVMDGNTLNDGGWHQVAVSMPHLSSPLSKVKFYIDGILTQTSVRNDVNLFFFNYGRISIGSLGFSSTTVSDFPMWKSFHGYVNDVFVWGRTITPSHLKQSPKLRLRRTKNSCCESNTIPGMKKKVIAGLRNANKCKRRCQKKPLCLGAKFEKKSKYSENTVCILFKNMRPVLVDKLEKKGQKCFITQ